MIAKFDQSNFTFPFAKSLALTGVRKDWHVLTIGMIDTLQ